MNKKKTISVPQNLISYTNELYHHGTKRHSGRYPWGSGERPYQGLSARIGYNKAKSGIDRNYFTKERTIKAGTVFYRTTTSKNGNQNDNGDTYVTYLQEDRNLYRGGAAKGLRGGNQKSYEHQYVLKKDLKVPSQKEVLNVIKEKILDNPDNLNETVKAIMDKVVPNKSIKDYNEKDKKELQDILDTLNTSSVDTKLALITAKLSLTGNNRKIIEDELSKRGYNAMTDEHGVGDVFKMGIDPLIIFNKNNSLEWQSSSEISSEEEEAASKQYQKWYGYANIRSREWPRYVIKG